jgi:hypothetical protein
LPCAGAELPGIHGSVEPGVPYARWLSASRLEPMHHGFRILGKQQLVHLFDLTRSELVRRGEAVSLVRRARKRCCGRRALHTASVRQLAFHNKPPPSWDRDGRDGRSGCAQCDEQRRCLVAKGKALAPTEREE